MVPVGGGGGGGGGVFFFVATFFTAFFVTGLATGFAVFFATYSTFLARPGLYLEDLFVLADHRGRGVGRALLAHLAHLAVERGCGRLEWSVLNWNQAAIRFYERLGARPNSEWTVYWLPCSGNHPRLALLLRL